MKSQDKATSQFIFEGDKQVTKFDLLKEKTRNMKKSTKIGIAVILIIALAIIERQPISLGLMNLVDMIGSSTGADVSKAIDILNMVYYL